MRHSEGISELVFSRFVVAVFCQFEDIFTKLAVMSRRKYKLDIIHFSLTAPLF